MLSINIGGHVQWTLLTLYIPIHISTTPRSTAGNNFLAKPSVLVSHCSEYLQQIQNEVHSVLGVRKSHVKQYLPGVVEVTNLCNRKSCEGVFHDIKSTWSVNISSVIHILRLESANLDWPFCCVLFSEHFSKIIILW